MSPRVIRPFRCVEIVDLVGGYLDGALSRRQLARFNAHIEGCDDCRRYLAQMRVTMDLTGRLRDEDLGDEMRAEFGAIFRRMRPKARSS